MGHQSRGPNPGENQSEVRCRFHKRLVAGTENIWGGGKSKGGRRSYLVGGGGLGV